MYDLLCALLVVIPMAGLAFFIACTVLNAIVEMIGDIIGGTIWVIRSVCAGIASAAKALMLRLRRRGQS